MRFILYTIPKPKQSFRVAVKNNKIVKFTDSKIKYYENDLKNQIKKQLPTGHKLIEDAIKVTHILYVFPVRKTEKKQNICMIDSGNYLLKTTKPDLSDNLQKALFDAMEGIVYKNDSQICIIENIKKVYGTTPRIEIELEIVKDLVC